MAATADNPDPSLVVESGPNRCAHSRIEQDQPDVVTAIGDHDSSSSIRFEDRWFGGGVVRDLSHGSSSAALSPIETLEDEKKFTPAR